MEIIALSIAMYSCVYGRKYVNRITEKHSRVYKYVKMWFMLTDMCIGREYL